MANAVLYFPSIRVPEGAWLTRVLLYWDTVGTIVPYEYADDVEYLRPFTASLIRERLLTPVIPDQRIWQEGGPRNYRHAFLELLDSHPWGRLRVGLDYAKTDLVHLDKIGAGLAADLADRGLARHVTGPEWNGWYEVEHRSATLLMAFLATILGQSPGHEMDPITDKVESLAAFTKIHGGALNPINRLDSLRDELLTNSLPAPIDPVEPIELRRFKEKHHDQLVRFRTLIESVSLDLARTVDPDLAQRQLQVAKDDLALQLEDITARMREHRWRRLGLGALLAVAAGGVTLIDAAVTRGALTVAGASLGLASAAYQAFDGLRTPKSILERPMAYAVMARRLSGRL